MSFAKPFYDEVSATYDDPLMFYDGFDPDAWTKVPKPTDGSSDVQWQQMIFEWQNVNTPWEGTFGSNGWIKV